MGLGPVGPCPPLANQLWMHWPRRASLAAPTELRTGLSFHFCYKPPSLPGSQTKRTPSHPHCSPRREDTLSERACLQRLHPRRPCASARYPRELPQHSLHAHAHTLTVAYPSGHSWSTQIWPIPRLVPWLHNQSEPLVEGQLLTMREESLGSPGISVGSEEVSVPPERGEKGVVDQRSERKRDKRDLQPKAPGR